DRRTGRAQDADLKRQQHRAGDAPGVESAAMTNTAAKLMTSAQPFPGTVGSRHASRPNKHRRLLACTVSSGPPTGSPAHAIRAPPARKNRPPLAPIAPAKRAKDPVSPRYPWRRARPAPTPPPIWTVISALLSSHATAHKWMICSLITRHGGLGCSLVQTVM